MIFSVKLSVIMPLTSCSCEASVNRHMRSLTILRAALLLLLITAIATGKDKTPPTYQQGTITGWSTQVYQKSYARDSASLMGHKKFYDLKGGGLVYQIAGIDHPWRGAVSACGPFDTGQAVDYRIEDNKIYIRRENGKEQKCDVASEKATEGAKPDAPSTAAPPAANKPADKPPDNR